MVVKKSYTLNVDKQKHKPYFEHVLRFSALHERTDDENRIRGPPTFTEKRFGEKWRELDRWIETEN